MNIAAMIGLLRRASSQAYQVLLKDNELATYAHDKETGTTSFFFEDEVVFVKKEEKDARVQQRRDIAGDIGTVLHDLIYDSIGM